jgi:hypothetical protein
MKICRERPNLVISGQDVVHRSRFHFCRRHKFRHEITFVQYSIFIPFTLILHQQYTQHIVAFSLQQWLCKDATMLRYRRIACSVNLLKPTGHVMHQQF